MINDGVNKSRRRLLIGATSVVSAFGAVGAAVPFVASWTPSAKARAAGAPVKVDISKLESGQQMVIAWRGKPVWVVRRTQESLDSLSALGAILADPDSVNAKQPDYIPAGPNRSLRPEIIVMTGLCTHLGCSPTYRPEVAPADLGPDWKGGFFCPCHGSRFDLSGRVYAGLPAPDNLEIPPHYYISDTVILIGKDGDKV
jgi:ubiquinol-cytochrome c reductase iron-sulfur subunit